MLSVYFFTGWHTGESLWREDPSVFLSSRQERIKAACIANAAVVSGCLPVIGILVGIAHINIGVNRAGLDKSARAFCIIREYAKFSALVSCS